MKKSAIAIFIAVMIAACCTGLSAASSVDGTNIILNKNDSSVSQEEEAPDDTEKEPSENPGTGAAKWLSGAAVAFAMSAAVIAMTRGLKENTGDDSSERREGE